MKSQKNNKKIILSSLILSSVVATATALTVVSSQQNNLKFKNVESLLSSKQNKQVSNQEVNIQNPDEVFYSSQKLNEKNPWDETTPPGSEIQANKELFEKVKANIEKLKELNGESNSLKSLEQIPKEVEGFLKFKDFEKKYIDSGLVGILPWEQVKDNVLQQLGAKENFNDVSNISNYAPILRSMSGIIENGSVIRNISNKKYKLTDISANNVDSMTTDLTGVESVAGVGYKNLVKIAEINLTENKNYILSFEYLKNSNLKRAKGKLILKNNDGQLNNTQDLREAYKNFDIFGRFDLSSSDKIDQGSFTKLMKNFVIQKNGSTLSILIRTNEEESFNNLKFETESDMGTPTKFGILNVQADSSKTFLDYVENRENADVVGKLMQEQSETANQINTVQFYSQKLLTTRIRGVDKFSQNREINFYQGANQNIKFDLNYVTSKNADLFTYDLLTSYDGGINTNKPISLNLEFDGTKPTEISEANKFYDFFPTLKDNLPTDIKEQFPNISTINIKSELISKTAKQTISFSDNFYGLGTRNEGWQNVNVANSYEIQIPNLLDKVFFEKPEFLTEQASDTKNSTYTAIEKVDEKSSVVKMFSTIYQKWADNDLASLPEQRFSVNSVPVIGFESAGGEYKNIELKTESINVANGHELYNKFNAYWKDVATIIQKYFDSEFKNNEDRYKVNSTNSASKVITTWMLGNFENIPNINDVSNILNEAVGYWNKDSYVQANPNAIPNFEQLQQATKEGLSNSLWKLVVLQYSAIVNEFSSIQLLPIYQKFTTLMQDNTVAERKVIKTPAEILEFIEKNDNNGTPQFIKYKSGAISNGLTSTKQAKFSEVVKSIIDLFKFGNEKGKSGLWLVDGIISDTIINENFREIDLLSFQPSLTTSGKQAQMRVYNAILSFFGYSFNNSYDEFLKNPSTQQFELKFNVNGKSDATLNDVFEDIVEKISSSTPTNKFKFPTGGSISSYWLDDIITGSNIVSSLKWKLNSIPSTLNTDTSIQTKVKERIKQILVHQQAKSSELSAWANALKSGSWDYLTLSKTFSGREGDEIIKRFKEITQDKVILAKRTETFSSAELKAISDSIKYIWFIVVALIGTGIIVSSTLGIVTKAKQAKLSAHPVIKWILISLIVLGLAIVVSSIAIGVSVL